MYPCCIIIALLLLSFWGFRDKIKVLFRRAKQRMRGKQEAETTGLAVSLSLKEELRQTTYFEKKNGEYSDGRTPIIPL